MSDGVGPDGALAVVSDFCFFTKGKRRCVRLSYRAVAAENPSDFVFVSLETPKNNPDPLVLGGACVSARSLVFVAVPNKKFGLLLVASGVVFISLLLLVDFPLNVDGLNNLMLFMHLFN